MKSMNQVRLNNHNGYDAVEDYPFPVVVMVKSAHDRFNIERDAGNIEVSFRELARVAPSWEIPWWLEGHEDDTIFFSRGDHFEHGERDGWTSIDDNPFAHWNSLKSSRPVGAL